MERLRATRGFTILEPLLAASILALLVLGILSALVYAQDMRADTGERERALLLANEGLEAVRSMRDSSGTLEVGTYDLEGSGGYWSLTSPTGLIEERYERIIIIEEVSGRKKITTTVSWGTGAGNRSVTLETYLTSWR